jgi:hypothetical protein
MAFHERERRMSYMEEKVSAACAYLEAGMSHEDETLESEYTEGITFSSAGNCTCGHTGRSTGPDYRPASVKTCTPDRMCFKGRGHF